jgi:hypothetical protein
VRVDHGVVAGADVAGVLAGAGRDAVAALAADVALVVAHLVLPVVAATAIAHLWAVCSPTIVIATIAGEITHELLIVCITFIYEATKFRVGIC